MPFHRCCLAVALLAAALVAATAVPAAGLDRAPSPARLELGDPPEKAMLGDGLGGLNREVTALVLPAEPVAARTGVRSLSRPEPRVVRGSVAELRELVASGAARAVRPIRDPKPLGVATEGTELVGANTWHDAGHSGRGVKVAILDTGFAGYEARLGTELPATVVARSFHRLGLGAAGDSHGTAVAEIVFDIAPAATFYLVNFDGAGFAGAVEYLIGEEVDIINMSAGWTVGPFDGTSDQAAVVDRAIDGGVVWINAAGNYADRHFSTQYVDANTNGWAELREDVEANAFTVPAFTAFTVDLTWTNRDADLDLCVYDLEFTPPEKVRCSAGIQRPGDLPVEFVESANTSAASRQYGFAVSQCSGYWQTGRCDGADLATRFDVYADPVRDLEFQVPDYSLAVPGDVERVITVGAVGWATPAQIEPYSSRGPTLDGRVKPDLVAPTGVATATFAGEPFEGTSSAAPHVAGLAALYLGAHPGTTPEALRAVLAGLADPRPSGSAKNTVYGWGLVQAGPLPAEHSWVGVADPLTGRWELSGPDGLLASFYYGTPSDLPLMCDWDGDGTETVGLYRPTDGYLYLRNSNTQGFAETSIFYGVPEDVPVCGDWDGDGVDTIGVYRPSESRFYLRNSNSQGFADVGFVFGEPGDVPFAGDWNGDGIDTVGVYRPGSGRVYVIDRHGAGFADFSAFYGMPGDRFVAGDWDGDGRDTFGIFRPSEASFYLSNSIGNGFATQVISLGSSSSLPVAGRWG